jgi:osmotically-inducible protein OsmY
MRTGSTWSLVAGFVLGGATAALVGRRWHRRAMEAAGLMGRRRSGLRQRLRGVVYQTQDPLSEEIPDDLLVERVRAQLVRPVSHPDAVDVRAQDGCVILAGPILADEVDDLIRQVSCIAGVRSIRSELDLHDEPGDLRALQH